MLSCFVIRLRGTSLVDLCARHFFSVLAILLPLSHYTNDLCLNPPAFHSLHESIDFIDDEFMSYKHCFDMNCPSRKCATSLTEVDAAVL